MASIFDYDDAGRAGRSSATNLINTTGITKVPSNELIKKEFEIWWMYDAKYVKPKPPDKSGNRRVYVKEFKRVFKSRRNPARSGKQYRAAQAVLSGVSDIMPVKVAREIVDKTGKRLRSEFARGNPSVGAYQFILRKTGELLDVVDDSMFKEYIKKTPEDIARELSDEYDSHVVVKHVKYKDKFKNPILSGLATGVGIGAGLGVAREVGGRIKNPTFKVIIETYNGDKFEDSVVAKYQDEAWDKVVKKFNISDGDIKRSGVIEVGGRLGNPKVGWVHLYNTEAAYKPYVLTWFDGAYREEKSFHTRHDAIKYFNKEFERGSWKLNEQDKIGNPSTVATLSENFHGRPVEEITEVVEEEKYRDDLAKLGMLTELEILCKDGKNVIPIAFSKSRNVVDVAASGNGKQIAFVGGNQRLNLVKLEVSKEERGKDLVEVGPVVSITYFTDKHHLEGPEYQKDGTEYWHKFGEEGGDMPVLVYDRLNESMVLVGGSYEIKKEGIRN